MRKLIIGISGASGVVGLCYSSAPRCYKASCHLSCPGSTLDLATFGTVALIDD
jgi:hypothetical protein